MPGIDKTDKYFRVRQRDPADFVEKSLRTVPISEEEGISSVMGRLRSDPDGAMHVQSLLFAVELWNEGKIRAWIEKHPTFKILSQALASRVATIDLTARASEVCVDMYRPSHETELQDRSPGVSLRRRIVAVSEGEYNGVRFKADEIEAMVKRAIGDGSDSAEAEANLHIPLILDHSDSFMGKVGSAYALVFGVHPEDGRPAAIADVELWSSTPMLNEVAERVRLDPENTFFSVRVRGELRSEPEGEYLSGMRLVHIAIVNEPADPTARLISELAEPDLALYGAVEQAEAITSEEGTMTEKDLEALRKEHEEELAKLRAQHEAEVAELRKASEARLKELKDLEAKRSEIISLDQAVDRDFLLSLSGEQLAGYRADLERRLTETELKEKAKVGAGGRGEDPFELATRYFGKAGV